MDIDKNGSKGADSRVTKGTIKLSTRKKLSLSSSASSKDAISGRAIKQFVGSRTRGTIGGSSARQGAGGRSTTVVTKRSAKNQYPSSDSQNDSRNRTQLTKNEQKARIAALKNAKSLESLKNDSTSTPIQIQIDQTPQKKPIPITQKQDHKTPKRSVEPQKQIQPKTSSPLKKKRSTTNTNNIEAVLYSKHSKTAVAAALNDDIAFTSRKKVTSKKKRSFNSSARSKKSTPKIKLTVTIKGRMSLNELSVKTSSLKQNIRQLINEIGGTIPTDEMIDPEVCETVASFLGHQVQSQYMIEDFKQNKTSKIKMQTRPPVITIMGHVNHGKTTLIDALRGSKIAQSESGGITQNIGAYQINSKDKIITVIDTPGHEVFSQMRHRGASVTDIVVLVIAATEGVQQQTIEAISHAQSAGVPIIVAINKIDKPSANVDLVATQLANHNLLLEEFGGNVISVKISASEGKNLDQLEEAILMQAELLDLKADLAHPGYGIVLESRLDTKCGPMSTVLVQHGSIKIGNIILADKAYGKIRAMMDHNGNKVKEAGPSTPVEIMGLNAVSVAGTDFYVVKNEKNAKSIISQKESLIAQNQEFQEELDPFALDESKELLLIVKCNVHGALDALISAIEELQEHESEIKLKILQKSLGPISESDITLAQSMGASIVCFGVNNANKYNNLALKHGVRIHSNSIIYELLDDLRNVMNGLLKPVLTQNIIGTAEVRQVFSLSKHGYILGCYVTSGVLRRGIKSTINRKEKTIVETEIKTLRRFKEDVKEVQNGYECGLVLDSKQEIQIGDVIKVYEEIEERREIEQKKKS